MATKVNYPTYSFISAITNGQTPTVTMTAAHDFTIGEIVSFRVGRSFVMNEINNKRAKISSVTSDTIVIDIDTTNWGVFSLANLDTDGTSPPICVPSSSGSLANESIPRTNILDAFDVRRS